MQHPAADPAIAVRTVFVVDLQKEVRLFMVYPPSTGRNFDEILRVIDSLQLADCAEVATPVNWRSGERGIIPPSIPDERAKTLVPQGLRGEGTLSARR